MAWNARGLHLLQIWSTWSVTDGASKFLQLRAWRRKSCLGKQWLQEPELRVDETRQNVPSQEVTVNLSAFIKERPNTRALTSEIRSPPCFMPSMYSWKVHVNQMHANQSTFPRDFHFHFRAALSFFSDWCSVDSGFNNATLGFSALSPRLSAKWLIMCKQTFTCTRDLLIKNSSGVKAFAKNPLCKEKATPTYIWWAGKFIYQRHLKVRNPYDKQAFWLVYFERNSGLLLSTGDSSVTVWDANNLEGTSVWSSFPGSKDWLWGSMTLPIFWGEHPSLSPKHSNESKEMINIFQKLSREEEAHEMSFSPVATKSPGAVSLLEILPEEYGFSEICKCRCKEQKG